MLNIEIYTRPGCGYCQHAKTLLSSKGLTFEEYNVYSNPKFLGQMHSRTTNRTYPQVFINNQSIGGFSELLQLEQADGLTRY